jgi:hypothetical protein
MAHTNTVTGTLHYLMKLEDLRARFETYASLHTSLSQLSDLQVVPLMKQHSWVIR